MSLMLALAHRVPQEDRAMHQGLWQTGIGFDLSGKVLGIVGLGRIGTRIAAVWQSSGHAGAGMERESHRAKGRRGGSHLRDSSTICSGRATSITLHLRLSERTNRIITARHISLMKPTASFVNTARGPAC